MRNIFSKISLLSVITIVILAGCEHKPNLNNYNWILGEWEVRQEHSEIFEVWKPIADTIYEGYNFTVQENGDTNINEHLWLESRGGKVILSAKVFGQNDDKRIFFTLTKKDLKTARFENQHHDFPTMIEYHKSGTHFLEVHVKNEDKSLPPIKMHKIES